MSLLLVRSLLVLCSILGASLSQADSFVCQQTNGKRVVQTAPCPPGSKTLSSVQTAPNLETDEQRRNAALQENQRQLDWATAQSRARAKDSLPAVANTTTPLYLFGGSGHKAFLGCLNCGELHPKSVWNEISQFGFRNDLGIWNPIGQYANPLSAYSMCNQLASDPPVVVDDNGNFYGRMSVNELTMQGVCGLTGNARLCQITQAVCQSKGS